MPFAIADEWLAQAGRDLDVAKHLRGQSYFEWACYAAQQCAEKAVKAVRICLGTQIDEMKKHDLADLLAHIPTLALRQPDPDLGLLGTLTTHNMASRYPGPRAKGQAPFKTYDQPTADEAIRVAEKLFAISTTLRREVELFWDGPGKI